MPLLQVSVQYIWKYTNWGCWSVSLSIGISHDLCSDLCSAGGSWLNSTGGCSLITRLTCQLSYSHTQPTSLSAQLIAHSESTFSVSLQILKTAWNHKEAMPILKIIPKYLFHLILEGEKKQRSSSCCYHVIGIKELIPLWVRLHCRPLPLLTLLAQTLITKPDKLWAINN